MAQGTEAASSGAVDGSFPSPQIVAEAGLELAQKLGLPLEEGLDRIVSAVLQQRGGVTSSHSAVLLVPSIPLQLAGGC